MASVKTKSVVENEKVDEDINVQFICPVCKKEKLLPIKKTVLDQSKQLLTISIPKNKICSHHFQAFIDKNYKVRGYQKVDITFEPDIQLEKKEIIKNLLQEDYDLFKNLILKGNTLEYNPNNLLKNNFSNINKDNKDNSNYQKTHKKMRKNEIKKKSMSLKEIYEEFWEFIDENNHDFRELIIKDPRRRSKQFIS